MEHEQEKPELHAVHCQLGKWTVDKGVIKREVIMPETPENLLRLSMMSSFGVLAAHQKQGDGDGENPNQEDIEDWLAQQDGEQA